MYSYPYCGMLHASWRADVGDLGSAFSGSADTIARVFLTAGCTSVHCTLYTLHHKALSPAHAAHYIAHVLDYQRNFVRNIFGIRYLTPEKISKQWPAFLKLRRGLNYKFTFWTIHCSQLTFLTIWYLHSFLWLRTFKGLNYSFLRFYNLASFTIWTGLDELTNNWN